MFASFNRHLCSILKNLSSVFIINIKAKLEELRDKKCLAFPLKSSPFYGGYTL